MSGDSSEAERFSVCFLNTRLFPVGGTAIRTLNFARAISNRVKKIRVITWQPADDCPPPKRILDYAREGIYIETLQIRHHFLKKHIRLLYLFALGLEYLFFVIRSVREQETDVIHCSNETFWMGILIRKILRKPIIADIHAIPNILDLDALPKEADGLGWFLSKTMLRIAGKLLDGFLVPTDELKDYLVSSGIPSCKVKTITNAMFIPKIDVKQSRAAVRGLLGFGDETTVVAFHGILNTSYNINAVHYLGEISRIVSQKLNNKVKFMIMGYYDKILVKDSNFIYTGYVENLYEYLSAADFALVPIFDNSLGIRSRLLDYIAISLPVITTPVGVTGMKFTQESGAVIVRKNVEELAESTIELARSPEKVRAMTERSKSLISCFSPDSIANSLLSSYSLVVHPFQF